MNKIKVIVSTDRAILEYTTYGLAYRSIDIANATIRTHTSVDKLPFLLEHNREQQIGVVDKLYVEDNKLIAEVTLNDTQASQDIINNIRKNISFSFYVNDEYESEYTYNDLPVVITTDLEITEISSVSIPADPDAGVLSIGVSQND